MTDSYENFDIQVIATGLPRKYKLLVKYPNCQPPNGKYIDCELPPSYADLLFEPAPEGRKRWRRDPSAIREEENLLIYAAGLETVKEVGRRLFETLLPGELAGRFGAVADTGRLRLRINLTQAPELSREPWEALYRTDSETLLAIDTGAMIVRQLDPPTPPDRTPVTPPVRLLIFSAVPEGDLDVAREVANIGGRLKESIEAGLAVPFEVSLLEKATRLSLYERLRTFRPHLLHYVGHGSFERGSGWIHLHHPDDERRNDPVDAETLRDMLANHRPKLVVLNTCQGATAASTDTFGGTAQALIQRNIPYVVAMQYPVSDQVAIAFSDSLYADLARGDPVDVAVTKARNSIRILPDAESQVELITPVLYISGQADALIVPPGSAVEMPLPQSPRVAQYRPIELPASESVTLSASSAPAAGRGLTMLLGAGGAVLALVVAVGLFNPFSSGEDSANNVSTNFGADMNAVDPAENALDSIGDITHVTHSNTRAGAGPDRPSLRPPRQAGSRSLDATGVELPPRRPVEPPAPETPTPTPPPPGEQAPGPYMVVFPWQSAEITGPMAELLDNAAAAYRSMGPREVVLSGHASGNSSSAVGLGLSRRRAEAVREYLAARGVPAEVMSVEAFGESRPLVETPDGVRDPQNDRVELAFGPPRGDGVEAPAEAPELPELRLLGAPAAPGHRLLQAAADFSRREPDLRLRIVGRGGDDFEARQGLAEFVAAAARAAGVEEGRLAAQSVPGPGSGEPEAELGFVLPGAEAVRFGLDETRIDRSDDAALGRLAEWLRSRGGLRLLLRGHADSSGPAEYNEALALRRAEQAAERLAEAGIARDRITVESAGERLPSPGLGPDSARDRRVELLIIPE
jgi:outer membrane protein OmpA-like peptidoglycan-associated protein